MKSINLIFLIIILGFSAHAQAPDTLWTRTFGGPFNDYGRSLDITFDGDYVIAGEIFSLETGSYDIYLIKIDPDGDTLWSKTYGGINSEYGNSVIQTSDGGFAVVGETRSFGAGSYDVYFLKTDANGDTLWARTYGGDDYEEGHSIFQTSDGGYIITGLTRSSGNGEDDVFLIKTDSAGNITWIRTYGGAYHDWGNSVMQTPDDGFIVAGVTDTIGSDFIDVYVIRTDADGDTIWTRTIGGGGDDCVFSIQESPDSGYILAGFTSSFGAGIVDGYLVNINDSGDTIWTRTYGGGDYDNIKSACQTSDGGYILAGLTQSFGAIIRDVYIIKIDSFGNVIWSGIYGGPGADLALSIKQTSDDGYIIAGATTSYGAGNHDVYIVKLSSDQTSVADRELSLLPDNIFLHTNYPNPFNAATVIRFALPEPQDVRLTVYDLLGRKIQTLVEEYMQAGIHAIAFDASDLSSGIYFCRLQSGDMVETRRMVLLK